MISIIIPCFNCETLIARAIESVLGQKYHNWELILVNNNSTDRTEDRLEAYRNMYPSKIKILQEQKKGAPAARNKGLQIAQFPWIQYLDADDELLPEKLSSQIQVLKDNTINIIAGTAMVKSMTKGSVVESVRFVHEDAWTGLIRSALGITSANLYQKDLLHKVDGWDEALSSSQEYDLLFRCMQHGAKVKCDPAVNTIIYKVSDSISNTADAEKLKMIITNRINLRLNIKRYLASQGLLTSELEKEINNYIYNELMSHKRILGKFVDSTLADSNVNVSLAKRLLWQVKLLKR